MRHDEYAKRLGNACLQFYPSTSGGEASDLCTKEPQNRLYVEFNRQNSLRKDLEDDKREAFREIAMRPQTTPCWRSRSYRVKLATAAASATMAPTAAAISARDGPAAASPRAAPLLFFAPGT